MPPGLSLTIAASGAPPARATAAQAAMRACQPAIERRLAEWGASAERYRDPAGPMGAREWRIATREIGTWLLLHEPADDAPSVARVGESATTRVTFDARCREDVSSEQRARGPEGAFTDRELKALVDAEPRGVIFVWSPHMPLSVEAYRTVADVARRMALSFTALRDPMSDASYAASVAKEAGLPADALRTFASVELTFRQATLHAPAVLVFAGGRFAGMAVPGYREAAGYEAAIAGRLAGSGNRE